MEYGIWNMKYEWGFVGFNLCTLATVKGSGGDSDHANLRSASPYSSDFRKTKLLSKSSLNVLIRSVSSLK